MASLPSATTRVSTTAGAIATGTGLVCVLAPVAQNADMVPRVMASGAAVFDEHGYGPGVEYVSGHVQRTSRAALFVGMPIGTQGVIGRKNTAGNSGSSVVSITAGGSGVLQEHDGVIEVDRGGTIGTDQIVLKISADGGYEFKTVRLGTSNSYADPLLGVTLGFGAGTLIAGDTIATWHGSGPKINTSDLAQVRANLAGGDQLFRSAILCGDLPDVTAANALADFAHSYDTENGRFIFVRGSLRDRLPLAALSSDTVRMTGAPALTFAEVGATGDTITRATGSWLADGFAVGDIITVTGTASNNVTGPIASLSATVITLGTTDLVAEITSVATVTAVPGITFAEVGATGDTITRSRGSWIDDGFRVGDLIIVTGTASNNITAAQGLAAVTGLVLTLGTDDLAAEVIGASSITLKAGQTEAAWVADLESSFATCTDKYWIDLSIGREVSLSQFSGWNYRWPKSFVASWREYQHDVHIPTWRKADGPSGGTLKDPSGTRVEYDDRVGGGAATAARFTASATYANDPSGVFIGQSLTRAADGDILSQTHNVAVLNLARTVVQAATEFVIGQSLLLNLDGTASTDALAQIEQFVNGKLEQALLRNVQNEGQRASFAKWTASRDDILNQPDSLLTGVLDLELNGTIHSVDTEIKVS